MSSATAVIVPRESNNDEVVTLVKWYFRDGDEVVAGQVIADVEGSKATFEVVAPNGGFIQLLAVEGQEVEVGVALCHVLPARSAAAIELAPAAANVEPERIVVAGGGAREYEFVRFSSGARALLEKRGLDVESFQGRGFVRSRDVLAALGERAPAAPLRDSPPSSGHMAASAGWARPSEPAPRSVLQAPAKLHALAPSKRTEARYIGAGYRATLPSSVTVCVATRGLKAALARRAAFDGNTTALIVYEAARLLRKYPLFNACYEDGEAYVYEQVNIGVAVDGGSGLKVPVLRNADTLTPAEVAAELRELLVAYAVDELTAEQQSAGTFTVTDLSGSNAFVFEPLINKGQSAILGVGAEFFPAADAGFFNLTLRFDHQLGEGRTAAAFLNDLAARLKGHEAAQGAADTGPRDVPHCVRCRRDHHELRAINRDLVRTVNVDGGNDVVCTVCLQGW